jgi:ABC-type amino acid transport/signal transduction systems, periplasmic component/domain
MKKSTKILAIVMALSIMVGVISGCTAKQATAGNGKKNRLDEIKARGYIEVATEPAFAPYEFIDPTKNGDDKYVGSDMKLSQLIADKLGVKLHIIPLEFSAVLSSITEKKYDLAISALAYTPARVEAMNLSKGYYFSKNDAGNGLLIRKSDAAAIKDASSLSEKTVVVQSGSLQELFATQQIAKSKELKRVSATPDGFLMVQEGKADACVTSISTAQLYIDANPSSGLMVVKDFKFKEDESTSGVRIGISKGEDELTAKVNEIIDEVVKSGDYEKWYKEYTEYAKNLGIK